MQGGFIRARARGLYGIVASNVIVMLLQFICALMESDKFFVVRRASEETVRRFMSALGLPTVVGR